MWKKLKPKQLKKQLQQRSKQQLSQRQQKKQQILSRTKTHLQLFGESVILTDIDITGIKKTSKKDHYELFCEQTLLDYLQPLVDKYSSQL